VVLEIESGKIFLEKARKIYDIGGGLTIQPWYPFNKIWYKISTIEGIAVRLRI
jgi:hypothetical protein